MAKKGTDDLKKLAAAQAELVRSQHCPNHQTITSLVLLAPPKERVQQDESRFPNVISGIPACTTVERGAPADSRADSQDSR